MSRVRPQLTYANVMVTLLAFVVLGGVAVAATSLPKNSVGNKQLKKNSVSEGKIREGAVTGAKVKDGSLTGADIVATTLGTVPYAEKAGSATSATTAQSATSAESAKSAQTATSAQSAMTAQNATSAEDAAELGGEPPSAYAPSSRFFYVTVDPSAVPAQQLFALPGGIHVKTDGEADEDLQLELENESHDEWVIALPGSTGQVALAPEGTGTFPPLPERTALIMLQDRSEPKKAVALQCGVTIVPPRLTCFATLSPALSP